ncbi:MAG: hypothetical protein ACTHNU_05395 [Gaiellales bacterium]
MSAVTPDADIMNEANRLLDAANAADVPVRLIGGLAVRLHVPTGTDPVFEREYKDIDLVTLKGKSRKVTDFMTSMGYEPDRVFNATNGHRRLLFYDTGNGRQVDVFVGSFEMCHDIPITERIALATHSIPLAELLLTKMQIVELNAKDQTDIVTMLYHHEVADDDIERINADRVAELCAADWGLWRTMKMNVDRVRESLATSGLPEDGQQLVMQRLDALWERVEAQPKSAKWKLRNRVGDKKRWYEEPEEVA